MNIDSNDPRITAYALGELDETVRAEIEAQIEQSKELRQAVEDVRATADRITEALQAEPTPTLLPDQRKTIETKAAAANGKAHQSASKPGGFWRRYWIPTTAAASVLIVAGASLALFGSLGRSRSDYKRLAAASNIKGGGISSKIYADQNAEEWMIPGRAPLQTSGDVRPALASKSFKPGERSVDTSSAVDARGQRYTPAGEPKKLDISLSDTDGVLVVQGPTERVTFNDVETSKIPWHRNGQSIFFGSAGGQEVQFGGGAGPTDETLPRPLVEVKTHALWTPVQSGGVRFTDYVRPSSTDITELPGVNLVYGFEGYDTIRYGYQIPTGTGEAYDRIVENPFLLVSQDPLSTFSIDVDTASYANVRRFLNGGRLPPPGAVRIEEMVNYFDYDYPLPTGDDPFSVIVDVADCPWDPDHLLARIGIKGQEFAPDERPPANLVFLIDVSGSMQPYNKLPLLKDAMRMLVEELSYDDFVAMVVYAGASGLVLESTSCDDKGTVLSALDDLQAGGSTNGGAGIQLAYDVAIQNFVEGGINRVILATDGDFNVGTTDRHSLTALIEEKAKSGVFLSVLGFGMGNLEDATLETLADKGNGNYAYIDTLKEARKVLVDQLTGTLMTIAKDVKIQVEFNPVEVSAYRLIGYENRLLAAQDFNDDTKDAGEIGAGHTVTAFYEIVPGPIDVDLPTVDPLRYQTSSAETLSEDGEPRGLKPPALSGELMTVKLRYKQPDGDTSKLIEVPVKDEGLAFAAMSEDFIFAASVASFGMLLRSHGTIPAPPSAREEGPVRDFTLDAVLEMAEPSAGDDPFGYRAEFITLVEQAASLTSAQP